MPSPWPDAAEELGPVRAVVDCAEISTPSRVLTREARLVRSPPTGRWSRSLIGSFDVLRLGAERMSRAEPIGEERGVIVDTASAVAFDGRIGQAAHS